MDIDNLRGVGATPPSQASVSVPKPHASPPPPVLPVLGKDEGEKSAPAKDVRPKLAKAVESVNKIMDQFGRSIRFDVQEDTHRIVALIVNRETGEVVKSIPAEEMLALMKRIDEAIGLFVDKAA